MTPAQVVAIRESLGLTQAQLAQLLGVHPLTVSKWERGVLSPNPHQAALLGSFRRAAHREPDVGQVVVGLLVAAGIGVALYALLRAAFEPDERQA